MQYDLTQGPIYSRLMKMSFSMTWGLLSIIGFNLADTYFIAKLGKLELASVNLCFPIILFFFSIALGLSTAVSSIISRSIGEKNQEKTRRYTSDALSLALIIVIFSLVLGYLFLDPVLALLGANVLTLPLAQDYMGIWFTGMLFLTVPMVGNGAIRAKGSMRVASFIMIVGAIINIILDPILIFGLGNFSGLGVKGAAYATVIARAFTLLASICFLHFKYKMINFQRPEFKVAIQSWTKILKLAVPIAGTNLLSPLAILVVTAIIARMGNSEMAAYGIVTKIESFAFIFVLALSSALGPFVGQNLGASRYNRISSSVKFTGIITFVWGSLIGLILYFCAPWLMMIFVDDDHVQKLGASYLTIVPMTYGLFGLKIVASSFFNAIGEPLKASIVGVIQYIILFIPFVFFGSELRGISGVFSGHGLTYVCIGVICIYLLNLKNQKYMEVKIE